MKLPLTTVILRVALQEVESFVTQQVFALDSGWQLGIDWNLTNEQTALFVCL